MKDRMGVRDHLQNAFEWKAPETTRRSSETRPGSLHSGQSGDKKSIEAAKVETPPEEDTICRALRCFQAFKH